MIGARVVWDQRFMGYDFGSDHPMHPCRLELTMRLLEELGTLDGADAEIVSPHPVSVDQLLTVHTPGLVEAVRVASADPTRDVGHGIGSGDTPAFVGMHEATALAVGGTVAACRDVWEGTARHTVNISGGLHHAMPDAASGFCVYNDVAVGIRSLLDQGVRKVAYIDLDVHHGDGVERVFWNDPRVLTVSIHETGRALFPGTGFPGDTGGPQAPDSAVNVALPPGTGDRGWLRAFHAVVPQVVRAFGPQILVTQHGCDAHFSDPLAHLAVSVDAMQAAAVAVHDLAHEVCGGRWVATGGGGYELISVVPRAWAHVIAIAAHRPIELTAPVPEAWREHVQRTYGHPGPAHLGDLSGQPIDYGRWEEGYDPADPVDSAVMATRRGVFPGWGLDPFFD